jgi:hypothetical protein
MAELFQVESLIPEDKLKELAAFMCKVEAQDNAPAVADPTLPQINGYTHSVQVDIIEDSDGNLVERIEKAHIIIPISQTAGVITEENRETLLPALKKLIGVSEGEVSVIEQYGQSLKLDTIYQQINGVNIKKEEKGDLALTPGTLICSGESWTRRQRALIVKALKDVTERYKIVRKYKDANGNAVKTEIDVTWPEVAFTSLEEIKNIYNNGIMEPWLNIRYYANRNDKDHGGTVSLSWQIADDPISKLIAKSIIGKNYCWVGDDVLRDEKDRFVMEVVNLSPEAQAALEKRSEQIHDEYLYSLIDLSKPITLWDNTILTPDGKLLPAGTDISSVVSQVSSATGIDASSVTTVADQVVSSANEVVSSVAGATVLGTPENNDNDENEEEEEVDPIYIVDGDEDEDEENNEVELEDGESDEVKDAVPGKETPISSSSSVAASQSSGETPSNASSFSAVRASLPQAGFDTPFKERFSELSDLKTNLTELSSTCGDIPTRISEAYAAINVVTPSGAGTAPGVVPAFLSSLKELKTRIETIISKLRTSIDKLPVTKYAERIPGFSTTFNTIKNFISMAESAISAIPI